MQGWRETTAPVSQSPERTRGALAEVRDDYWLLQSLLQLSYVSLQLESQLV